MHNLIPFSKTLHYTTTKSQISRCQHKEEKKGVNWERKWDIISISRCFCAVFSIWIGKGCWKKEENISFAIKGVVFWLDHRKHQMHKLEDRSTFAKKSCDAADIKLVVVYTDGIFLVSPEHTRTRLVATTTMVMWRPTRRPKYSLSVSKPNPNINLRSCSLLGRPLVLL